MKAPPEPQGPPITNPLALMRREQCVAALRAVAQKLEEIAPVPPPMVLSDLAVELEIAINWLGAARRRVIDARALHMGGDT